MRLITAFAILVGAGGNALLAISLGEGRHKDAERILNNSFLLITIFSVGISVLGLIFIHPLCSVITISNCFSNNSFFFI